MVTGAAGGIGAATAHLLAARGWTVIGVDVRGSHGSGDCSQWISGDVAGEDTWCAVNEIIASRFERLDLLVNNAAVMFSKSITDTDPAQWDGLMASNVRSCYLAVRALRELLVGGAIVNVASVHAVATSPNVAAYAASKGAVVSLSRQLAIELAQDDIRVNAVLPGAVDTPMLRSALSREHFGNSNIETRLADLASRTVNGRVARPSEIAEAILFLGDNQRSSFVNGTALVVDGGASIRLSTE